MILKIIMNLILYTQYKINPNKSKDFLKRTVKNLFSFETGLFDYLRKSF